MAVDLEELVPHLKAALNQPGVDAFTNATTNDWVLRLENAFWNARLDGLFGNYRAEDGLIEPITGNEDLPREQQQVLLIYSALDAVMAELRAVQSSFSAKAGPVEYSTSKSAPLLREVLITLRARLREIIGNLSSLADGDVAVLDAVIMRTDALAMSQQWWVR